MLKLTKLAQFCRVTARKYIANLSRSINAINSIKVSVKNVRFLQTTQTQFIDQEWRRENRLAKNPNRESPLTYLPDFTYMDG